MRSWASEFKQFVLRGNVVDLAVGIVIGVAFAAVVSVPAVLLARRPVAPALAYE
jgi:large conductance mechanosensitive channel protein